MITAILLIISALFVFWHGYVHAMGLYRARLQGRLVGLPLLLSLPVRFVGMDVAVVDKTASVALHGDGIVSAGGLVVSVSGGYGYIVARLT